MSGLHQHTPVFTWLIRQGLPLLVHLTLLKSEQQLLEVIQHCHKTTENNSTTQQLQTGSYPRHYQSQRASNKLYQHKIYGFIYNWLATLYSLSNLCILLEQAKTFHILPDIVPSSFLQMKGFLLKFKCKEKQVA